MVGVARLVAAVRRGAGEMRSRFLRHVLTTRWHLRRKFTPAIAEEIERAIRHSERSHAGELRVAIETSLTLNDLAAGITARERALEVFNELQVWDTAQNNGVLVYVLHAEQALEIVADRGYNAHVEAAVWIALCSEATTAFRAEQYGLGMTRLVAGIGAVIAQHFPPHTRDANELPDAPLFL